MRFAAIVCLALIGADALADVTDVDDPDTLTHLRAVHDALGTASRAISACAKHGGDRRECVCKHHDLVLEFHAAVKVLMEHHPEVSEYGTVNFMGTDGSTVAQNIPAMIRQVENPPDCS